MVKYQAHRGVSSENPENTMPAFVAAVEQGYDIIEADVSVTADMQFVLLHDSTINRTARNTDGSELENTVKIGDITYEQALKYDFGAYFAMKFEGTKIVLLNELLSYLTDSNVKLKIDNKYKDFSIEQKNAFFELIKPYQDIVQLTCCDINELEIASKKFSDMTLHYDGVVDENALSLISQIIPKEKLTVWVPVDDMFAFDSAKQVGSVGIWKISDYSQFDTAELLGADIIETDGKIKPERNHGIIADMHTHSKYSHDSTELIENTYAAEKERGISFFAVTDHCDTFQHANGDTFDYIAESVEDVRRVNAESDGTVTVLSGVEIGEGFWYPKAARRVEKMKDYDVILGSVHVLKWDNAITPYSGLNFAEYSDKDIFDYLTVYFSDMLTMLKTREFDILTHLTCPIRYFSGKYGLKVDITPHLDAIREILQIIIKRGIALEINTSSFGMIDDFMPSEEIIKMYYDMGGYLVTLGSDAHVASNAALYFDEAIKCLKRIGFRNVFYYKNRKCYQCSI